MKKSGDMTRRDVKWLDKDLFGISKFVSDNFFVTGVGNLSWP